MFAHGFNIQFGRIDPPGTIDVGMVAPKGPGHLLRSVYQAGGGVPALFAVEHDASGTARARVLAYARGTRLRPGPASSRRRSRRRPRPTCSASRRSCAAASSALVKVAFETLVEAGYQPELAYFETMHELKLIVDLMYRGGLNFMRFSVSDTAEYGDYVSGPRIIDERVRETMKDVLADIQERLVREPLDRRAGVRRRTSSSGSAQQDQRPPDRAGRGASCGPRWRSSTRSSSRPARPRSAVGAATARRRRPARSTSDERRRPVAPGTRPRSSTRPSATASRRPGAGLTAAEKLEVARQLARLKVDVIEAGFPAASPGDFEAVRRIAQETKGGIAVAALARCRDGDPQRAVEAIRVAERPHLHVFIATSDIHLKHKLRIIARARRSPRPSAGSATAARRSARDAEIEFSRRGRVADRHRLPPPGLRGRRRGRRVDGQHPGHRRLRDPGRVRGARRPGRRPRRARRDRQRPLPQRPRARDREHARRRPGRRAPGRGHDQRPRRAGRQRVARGGRDGPPDAPDPVPASSSAASRPSRSPRRRGS